MKKFCACDEDQLLESTEKPTTNARHPNIFSHTRECVAFAFDYGKCIVYTHMVAHVEIDIVTQTKHFKK